MRVQRGPGGSGTRMSSNTLADTDAARCYSQAVIADAEAAERPTGDISSTGAYSRGDDLFVGASGRARVGASSGLCVKGHSSAVVTAANGGWRGAARPDALHSAPPGIGVGSGDGRRGSATGGSDRLPSARTRSDQAETLPAGVPTFSQAELGLGGRRTSAGGAGSSPDGSAAGGGRHGDGGVRMAWREQELAAELLDTGKGRAAAAAAAAAASAPAPASEGSARKAPEAPTTPARRVSSHGGADDEPLLAAVRDVGAYAAPSGALASGSAPRSSSSTAAPAMHRPVPAPTYEQLPSAAGPLDRGERPSVMSLHSSSVFSATVRTADALGATLDAARSTGTPLLGLYLPTTRAPGPPPTRRAAAVVQFANLTPDAAADMPAGTEPERFALKFYLERARFEHEHALFVDSPLRSCMRLTVAIVDGNLGTSMSVDGVLLPPCVVMFAGLSLRDWASSRRRHFDELVVALADIAEELAAVHAEGYVHRNVKPTNLVLGGDGHWALTDFGVSALAGACPRVCCCVVARVTTTDPAVLLERAWLPLRPSAREVSVPETSPVQCTVPGLHQPHVPCR